MTPRNFQALSLRPLAKVYFRPPTPPIPRGDPMPPPILGGTGILASPNIGGCKGAFQDLCKRSLVPLIPLISLPTWEDNPWADTAGIETVKLEVKEIFQLRVRHSSVTGFMRELS